MSTWYSSRTSLIPQEKEKNADQEWWNSYFRNSQHQRSGSASSSSTTSSYLQESPLSPSLSDFPSPPRSKRSTKIARKPLPSAPCKEIVMRCRDDSERKVRRRNDEGLAVGTRMERVLSRVDLDKPLPPTPLVTFRNVWQNQNSWVDEKWPSPPCDPEKEGWL